MSDELNFITLLLSFPSESNNNNKLVHLVEPYCKPTACSSEEFECDRKCVPASWRCDGDHDCVDGSDEANCAYRPGCGPDRFKCHDGFGCIPKRWVCDGKAECRDGSDEMSCSQKGKSVSRSRFTIRCRVLFLLARIYDFLIILMRRSLTNYFITCR